MAMLQGGQGVAVVLSLSPSNFGMSENFLLRFLCENFCPQVENLVPKIPYFG